jgi:hypothetical protein
MEKTEIRMLTKCHKSLVEYVEALKSNDLTKIIKNGHSFSGQWNMINLYDVVNMMKKYLRIPFDEGNEKTNLERVFEHIVRDKDSDIRAIFIDLCLGSWTEMFEGKKINNNFLEDDNFILSFYKFIECTWTVVALLTKNINENIEKYCEKINAITRNDYVSYSCDKFRPDNNYYCGRAVMHISNGLLDQIENEDVKQKKTRILMYNTNEYAEKDEDYVMKHLNIGQHGGNDNLREKYMKYKNKYINLKKKIENSK